MHVGLGMNFQALDGKMSDAEVYEFELGLAARGRGDRLVWRTSLLPLWEKVARSAG